MMLIILGCIVGVIFGYFLESFYSGLVIGLIVIIGLYWHFIGPMHFVTKQRIKLLVENEILVNTEISPFSKDLSDFNIGVDWFTGEGVIDRFVDLYKTQTTPKGIFFYNRGIPYLPLFFIPLSSIESIQEQSEFITNNEFDNPDSIYELLLKQGFQIALPLEPKSAESIIQFTSN